MNTKTGGRAVDRSIENGKYCQIKHSVCILNFSIATCTCLTIVSTTILYVVFVLKTRTYMVFIHQVNGFPPEQHGIDYKL